MEAVLSLGSCLGDSAATLKRAVGELAALPQTRLVATSSLYLTEAVDVPKQYKDLVFANAIAIIDTGLSCDALSEAAHAIEARLGRVRTDERHAPRTIDIDLVACGDTLSQRDDLRLPHPEAARRRFVIEPLAEIRPSYILPGQGKTATEILAGLPTSPAVTRQPGGKLQPTF